MRSEIKSTQNETSAHHERNSVYITFDCRQNEMNFIWGGWSKKNGPLSKSQSFLFMHVQIFPFT